MTQDKNSDVLVYKAIQLKALRQVNYLNPSTIAHSQSHIQMTLCRFSSGLLCKVPVNVAGTVLCSVVWRRLALQYAHP